MIIDTEGVVIAHPDQSKLRELYNLKKLIKNVLVKDAAGEFIQKPFDVKILSGNIRQLLLF